MNTAIYLTDSSVDQKIWNVCQNILQKEANGMPIISVSQVPIDFGENICVGNIGRSWLSLYKQLYAGLEAAKTKHIVICEHDCIYSNEHLLFVPPRNDTMYYNMNHWLVQYDCISHPELNGMYSYWPRRTPMSQLIANRDFLLKDTELRVRLLVDPTDDVSVIRAQLWASRGGAPSIHKLIQHKLPDHPYERFSTKNPNLDIRHKTNFTGPKRGKKRCYELPYWGKFKDIIQGEN
jgi:hypothetical protein